jgi:VWFA-related protein
MNKTKVFAGAGMVCLIAAGVPLVARQNGNTAGEPVSVVATVEARRGKTIPPLEAQDILVREGHDRLQVTDFVPLHGQQGRLQLMLLIDDSARGTFDTEINTLKQFVNSLPPEAEVAVAYMRNGMAEVTANFTRDHASAANAIRVVMGPGGADVSPYDSLTDAIKKWPNSGAERKEVVMISSGLEALGGGYTSDNPYVNAGIESALKAGVVVYTIYDPSVGHFGHSFWRNTWGQNFLSQLSDETGGDSYIIGFGSPVSFQPFLESILFNLQHQYRLTFIARPENKSGFQSIRVSVTDKDASIAAPEKVFVRAGM